MGWLEFIYRIDRFFKLLIFLVRFFLRFKFVSCLYNLVVRLLIVKLIFYYECKFILLEDNGFLIKGN